MSFVIIIRLLWDWSRTVFGTIFVACVLMSLALLVVELIIYRVKRNAEKERDAA